MPDYTPEERQQLAQAFASTAAQYRRRKWIAAALGLGAVVLIVGAGKFCAWLGLSWWLGNTGQIAGFLLLGGGFFLWVYAVHALRCPNCNWWLNSPKLGAHCPECGSARSSPRKWWESFQCNVCGKSLDYGKWRYYRVHYCSECGLHLDEKGL